MASTAHHDGVLDSDKTYTHLAIARILGRNANWVIKMIVRLQVHHVKFGALYLVPGSDFMRAVERHAQPPGGGEFTDDDE